MSPCVSSECRLLGRRAAHLRGPMVAARHRAGRGSHPRPPGAPRARQGRPCRSEPAASGAV